MTRFPEKAKGKIVKIKNVNIQCSLRLVEDNHYLLIYSADALSRLCQSFDAMCFAGDVNCWYWRCRSSEQVRQRMRFLDSASASMLCVPGWWCQLLILEPWVGPVRHVCCLWRPAAGVTEREPLVFCYVTLQRAGVCRHIYTPHPNLLTGCPPPRWCQHTPPSPRPTPTSRPSDSQSFSQESFTSRLAEGTARTIRGIYLADNAGQYTLTPVSC